MLYACDHAKLLAHLISRFAILIGVHDDWLRLTNKYISTLVCVGDAWLFEGRQLQPYTDTRILHAQQLRMPLALLLMLYPASATAKRNTAAAKVVPQRCTIVIFHRSNHTNEDCMV